MTLAPTRRSVLVLLIVLTVGLVVVGFVSLTQGAVHLPLSEVW